VCGGLEGRDTFGNVSTCHDSCRDASPWSDSNPLSISRESHGRQVIGILRKLDFMALDARTQVYTFKLDFVGIVNYLQLDTDIERAMSVCSGLRVLAACGVWSLRPEDQKTGEHFVCCSGRAIPIRLSGYGRPTPVLAHGFRYLTETFSEYSYSQ